MAAAVDFTSGQDHALMMASRQDELLAKTSKIKKSLHKIWEMEKSLGELARIWEMENYQGELGENEKYLPTHLALLDLKKLISKELCLLRPSRAGSCKHGDVHPYPSLPMEGMTVNQGQERSVFLMVNFVRGKYTGALYEIKFNFGGELKDMGTPRPVAKFSSFNVRGARIFDRSQLYVFTEEGSDQLCLRSFGGFIFDTKTGNLDPLTESTVQFKPRGTFVSAYGTLYFLEGKSPSEPSRCLGFGKYDLDKKDWVRMPLFPFSYGYTMRVTGYAVCYGLILYTLSDLHRNFDVVAFHVARKDWIRVEVETYTPFRGRAVIVGETIYALNLSNGEEIIAYSLKRKEDDNGGTTYSLVQLFKLNDLEIAVPPLQFGELVTAYLVHLGNQDFVHVKTATNKECDEVQHVCITTFQIVQGRRHIIETLHSTILPMDIEARNWFSLKFCFTPECEDYEPVEAESAASTKKPKQEDEIILDESSFMWEEEASTK